MARPGASWHAPPPPSARARLRSRRAISRAHVHHLPLLSPLSSTQTPRRPSRGLQPPARSSAHSATVGSLSRARTVPWPLSPGARMLVEGASQGTAAGGAQRHPGGSGEAAEGTDAGSCVGRAARAVWRNHPGAPEGWVPVTPVTPLHPLRPISLEGGRVCVPAPCAPSSPLLSPLYVRNSGVTGVTIENRCRVPEGCAVTPSPKTGVTGA